MNPYTSNGHKTVCAESMQEAALIFAKRKARKAYGRHGDVRICRMGLHSQDMRLTEFSAFIGTTRGNETTGHDVSFTVYSATVIGFEIR
jgi:hypothetical protein